VAEPVSALRDLDELSGYTEQNPLSVGDDQQKAIQELERRGIKAPEQPEFGYDYGGDRGLTDIFMPFRREVISPERTIPTGNISFGPRGNMRQEVKTIPAQYGEPEFGMEYMPLVRGTKSALNAVGDLLFGDAKEQASVARSGLDMAEGLAQYTTEQVKAAASGGQYYDPEQQRIVSFDPTAVMIGGNPTAGQAVLASGVRLPSGGKKRAYEQYGGNLDDAREKLGITQEGTNAWRSTRKGFKSEIPQEIREAAQKVYDGDMDIQEYNNIVQRVLPPEPIGQVLEVPSYEEIAMALGKGEKTGGIIGVNVTLPDGTPASSRLDIPAYENQGTWVATVHDAGTSGTVLGYGPTAVLNNVSFNSKPNVALDIARGAKDKSTIGRMEGAWENRDPKVVEQQVRDILNGTAPDADQWVEVGMNPARGSGFYDKRNGQRLGETEQVLQVGPLVLAKRPTRIELDDPRNLVTTRKEPRLNDQGDPIFFSGGGSTGNRMAGASALSSVERARRAEEQGFGDVLYHATAPKEPIDQFKAKYPDGLNFLTTSPEFANRWLGKGGSRYNDADPELQRILKKDLAEIDKRYEERLGSIEGPDGENILSWPEKEQENYFRETGLAREAIRRTNQSIYPVRTNVQNTFDPRRDTDVLEELMRLEKVDPDSNTLNSGMTNRQTYQSGNYLLYENKNVVDFLKSKGYDSMRLAEDGHAGGDFETLAVFDPKNIRSVNAQFDPQQRESANILYSGGGNTGNRIATASALRDIGIADEFPTTFNQSTIDAYTEQNLDPRIFKTGAGAQPRSKEIQRNLDTNIEYGDQRLKDIPSLNLEDYEGYGFMSPIADTSGAGDVIKTINGVPVDVSRRGGQDFMFDPESGELLWASDYKVIRGMQENPAPSTFMGTAQELQKRTGKSPLLIPHSMTPTGVDFSQVAETMLGYAKNNMDKGTLKSLNKDIKEIYPDWLGLENKDAINNLNRASGEYRKKIINLLDQKYRNKGGLTAGQARLAMIDEDQRIIRAGTLRNVGAMDGFRNPLTGNPHPVYNAGMYGEGLGRINIPISVYELNPQAAQLGGLRLDQILRPPRATGKQGGLRSLEGSPLTGIITEDVLRGIEQRRN
tara:strand:+ start:47 stop:3367 length:3321 start_codon:yes stop_codon:yes gene_type:complete